jgi:hypothetical protein
MAAARWKVNYFNKRGEPVQVAITNHARDRFLQRWSHAFPDRPLDVPVDVAIATWFDKARRIHPKTRPYRNRLRRYGDDTLYFSAQPFVFVVQSAMLKTVELATWDTREKNKIEAPPGLVPRSQPDGPAVVQQDRSLAPSGAPVDRHALKLQQPTRFRIIAYSSGEDGRIKTCSLGSCDARRYDYDPERLREDEEFQALVRERFEKKRPGAALDSVWVHLGEKGRKVCVLG